jgi:hypothetical protein
LDFQEKVSIEIENSKKYTFKNPEVRNVFWNKRYVWAKSWY